MPMRTPLFLLLPPLVGAAVMTRAAAPVYKHKWDTVADLMAMHGQSANVSEPSILEFARENV
eukprot:COSAG05_NODE_6798_length_901_cov_1.604738_2_plen_62_part_00